MDIEHMMWRQKMENGTNRVKCEGGWERSIKEDGGLCGGITDTEDLINEDFVRSLSF